MNKVYPGLWALKWLGGIFFTPGWGRARYRWGGGVGPQANLESRQGEHSLGTRCIVSDYIRYEADGENVSHVSSPMPRWSRSNQTAVWWNVKVIKRESNT